MPRSSGRIQACTATEGRARLGQAAKFLEVAELVASERDIDESLNCAASLAVLAGIAAADAACCHALGMRSRAQDHRSATDLLRRIAGGEEAAERLRRLLAIKDEAQYGFVPLGATRIRRALRDATALTAFAERVA